MKAAWILVVSIAIIHLLHTKHYYKFNIIFLDFPWIHILIQQKIIICNCLIHIGMWLPAMKKNKNKSTIHMHKAIKLVLPSNWNSCTSKLLKDYLKNWSLKATVLHILSLKWKLLKRKKKCIPPNIVSPATLTVINLLGHVLICPLK